MLSKLLISIAILGYKTALASEVDEGGMSPYFLIDGLHISDITFRNSKLLTAKTEYGGDLGIRFDEEGIYGARFSKFFHKPGDEVVKFSIYKMFSYPDFYIKLGLGKTSQDHEDLLNEDSNSFIGAYFSFGKMFKFDRWTLGVTGPEILTDSSEAEWEIFPTIFVGYWDEP